MEKPTPQEAQKPQGEDRRGFLKKLGALLGLAAAAPVMKACGADCMCAEGCECSITEGPDGCEVCECVPEGCEGCEGAPEG